jgi:hypothetical protein
MPVDLAITAYLLSMVASTAKLLEFGFAMKGRAASPKDVDKIVKAAEAKVTSGKLGPEMVAMANTVSGPIQGAITKRILEIRDRIIKIVGDATLNPVDRRKMLNEDQRAFCEELYLLKKWNGGNLPPDLQREWESSKCDDFNYY